MELIISALQRHKAALIAAAGAALIIASVFIIRALIRRGVKNKDFRRAAEDKLRDENLNSVILNSHAGGGLKEVHTPYDVDYSKPSGNVRTDGGPDGGAGRHMMVQLVERTELSTRKFMLNPAKGIKIGSDLQGNDITVMAEGVSPRQCEIFSAGDKVYVRSLGGENRTIIRRKKERAIVGQNGVRLLTNDIIILGKASYEITISK